MALKGADGEPRSHPTGDPNWAKRRRFLTPGRPAKAQSGPSSASPLSPPKWNLVFLTGQLSGHKTSVQPIRSSPVPLIEDSIMNVA